MKVQFTEISTVGNHYTVTDDTWFARTDLRKSGLVSAELTLTKKSDTRVEVRGELKAGLLLSCDRCLADYSFAAQVAFHYILDAAGEENCRMKELECTKANLDIIQQDEPVADIPDLLRQQLYLALPEKKICSRDCRGMCVQCGADLNSGECSCADETADSPFSVLASLKKG